MPHNVTRISVLIGTLFIWAFQANGQTIVIEPPRIIHPPDIRPVPPPPRNVPLSVRKHNVDIAMNDAVAVTSIDQVFFNSNNRTVEGSYIFPLPDDVALSAFSMFVDGKEIQGKLLGVEEARRTYESIVASMRDPALLEYIGSKLFRARIFPIRPKSEVRVRLSYSQVLRVDNGLVHYRYPFGVEKHTSSTIESVTFQASIQSTVAIKNVFSPSHAIAVSRPSDSTATVSFEGKNVYPDKDFDLYYTLTNAEFGLMVLTHRITGQDGFFLARIAPPVDIDSAGILAKDIAFVIDTSGSMSGEKLHQAQAALKFCVNNLNTADRFNVISFAHEAIRFRDGLVPATADNVREARAFADGLRATGGTNIHDAIIAAMDSAPAGDADRPYLIVFMTDGQPTIGVTDPAELLAKVRRGNADRVRLFVFGVGHDVNTHLLDLLAEQNRGTRDYVEPGEDLELVMSSFYRKVSNPVLADLSLTLGGLTSYDVYPPQLGDLFAGSELLVVGRYAGEGAKAVELSGTRRGRREKFVYETNFPFVQESHEFLPRLWAMRKIGFLLDEIRLHGEKKELKDTVVELATKYGIVTPYTALLVTEPGRVAQGGRQEGWLADAFAPAARPARRMRLNADAQTGAVAVYESRAGAALKAADSEEALFSIMLAPAPSLGSPNDGREQYRPQQTVRRVASRTFYFVDGRWLDAGFTKHAETIKVELYSEAYFALIRKHSDLAKCFALGERVLVTVDGKAYETVPVVPGH